MTFSESASVHSVGMLLIVVKSIEYVLDARPMSFGHVPVTAVSTRRPNANQASYLAKDYKKWKLEHCPREKDWTQRLLLPGK